MLGQRDKESLDLFRLERLFPLRRLAAQRIAINELDVGPFGCDCRLRNGRDCAHRHLREARRALLDFLDYREALLAGKLAHRDATDLRENVLLEQPLTLPMRAFRPLVPDRIEPLPRHGFE